MKLKKNILLGLVILLLFSIPTTSFAAVNQKTELSTYIDLFRKAKFIEAEALYQFDPYTDITSANRKFNHDKFTKLIEYYQAYRKKLQAMNASSPELLTIHKKIINLNSQQIELFTSIKNELGKEKFDITTITSIKKIQSNIKINQSALDKTVVELEKYHTKVMGKGPTNLKNPYKLNGKFSPLLTKETTIKSIPPYADAIIDAYVKSLKAGNTEPMNTLLKEIIAPKEIGGIDYQYNIDKVNKKISSHIKKNGTKSSVAESNAILNAGKSALKFESYSSTFSDITVEYSLDIPNTSSEMDISVIFYLMPFGDFYGIESVGFYLNK